MTRTESTRPSVLVVDDEDMIRWSIEQTLSAAGYAVASATTAAEGLALFRKLRPAVVFLDVRLPDANGLAVLRCIKEEPGTKTAVIVMTAFEEGCTAAEALSLGAHTWLKKPFDFDQLARTVDDAVGAHPTEAWDGILPSIRNEEAPADALTGARPRRPTS